jgi:DNA-binding NarL/FixJ family response regulator
MRKMVHIIVVEPSPIIYEGLVQIIGKSELVFRIKQAGSLEEAERYLCARPNCLVILNPAFIQHNLREFSALKGKWPGVQWVALIYIYLDPQVLALFDGQISISDPSSVLVTSIQKVMLTEPVQAAEKREEVLSEREIEVLKLLALGMSNKEIAEKLNISVNTVITHRKNITQKTGIKTVSGLTIYAVINKLISLENTSR